MSFAIVYENFSDDAVLRGGSWALGLSNLQDPDIGLIARSASASPADTQFTVDMGIFKQVGGIVLGPTNLHPNSTCRFRAYLDAGMTTLLYDSGLIVNIGDAIDWAVPAEWLEFEDKNFWIGVTETDTPELPQYISHLIPEESLGAAAAQFWRVEIDDRQNTDGVITLGRLLMGRIYRPSRNYAYDSNEFGIQPITDITESLGGTETFWDRGLRRELRVAWPMLPETEVFDAWIRIMLRSRTSRQVFVVPEESDDAPLMRKRSFLARFKQTPRISQVLLDYASTAIDVQEIL